MHSILTGRTPKLVESLVWGTSLGFGVYHTRKIQKYTVLTWNNFQNSPASAGRSSLSPFSPLFDVESTGTAALAFQGIMLLPQFPQQPSILCLKNLAAITTAVDGQVHADGLREGRAIFRAQTFQIWDVVPWDTLPGGDVRQRQIWMKTHQARHHYQQHTLSTRDGLK